MKLHISDLYNEDIEAEAKKASTTMNISATRKKSQTNFIPDTSNRVD